MRNHDGPPGIFTLSLDCEGLWGMADREQVVSSGIINQAALRRVYATIADTLERHGLRATAAFVTCFGCSRDAVLHESALLEEMARLQPSWFRFILPMLRASTEDAADGWSGEDFWRMLAARGHEMAWHGTTHMPLTQSTPSDAVGLELELGYRLFRSVGHTPTSIVFPRNRVGHLPCLREAGFRSYRASPALSRVGRMVNIAREFHGFDRGSSQPVRIEDGWCVSPAGFFLNWPSHARSMVPAALTVQRWRSMLRAAADTGRYVHMWFHPHNFITAPAMQRVFEILMEDVARLVREGRILNLTMEDARRQAAEEELLA